MTTSKLAIFDLGNVVFRLDWRPMFDIWSDVTGVPARELQRRFRFDQRHEAFERGEIQAADFHQHACKCLGVQFSYSDFERGWNSIYQEVFDGMAPLLQHLKGRIQLVALTNTNEVHCSAWPDRYLEVLTHFEHVFISSKMGVRKPEAEAFSRILAKCGVQPDEAVFFDDLALNVEAARSFGLRAVLVDSPSAVRTGLAELGLVDAAGH